MLWLTYFFSFFQHCSFETLANFPIFWDLKKIAYKNENVELVPILFEPHCEYSPKKFSSWDSCSKVYFDEYLPSTF
jgi:hypothetical protein